MVSLGWCIRRGTRREGDWDADYLPPPKKSLPVIDKHVQCVISNGTDTVSWKFRWLGKFVGETRCCPMQRHVVHEDSELEVDRVGSMQLMSLWSPHVDY